MANYKFIDQKYGNDTPTATATFATSAAVFPRWAFGQTAAATDPTLGYAEFVYAQGSDVGTSGLVVQLISNSAVKLAAGGPHLVGVAQGVLSATNQAGWVQVRGLCDNARGTNVSLPANAPLFVGTAGGFLVSGSVANSRIMGLVAPASYTSSQSLSMSLQLNYPFCQFNTASM